MSLPVLIGFAGVLVAAAATGMLAGRCVREARVGFVVWTASTLALTIALAAQSMGFARGFSPVTFRAVQLAALLLAPLWLAWGLVELAAANEAVRFGARLVSGALTVVTAVILATDPLGGQPFGRSWPLTAAHFQPISRFALAVVQGTAVLAVAGLGLAVVRAGARGRAGVTVPAVAGVWPAGLAVLMTAGMRFPLPANAAYPLLSTAAAALVWFGASQAAGVPGPAAGRDSGSDERREGVRDGSGRYRSGDEFDDGYWPGAGPADGRAADGQYPASGQRGNPSARPQRPGAIPGAIPGVRVAGRPDPGRRDGAAQAAQAAQAAPAGPAAASARPYGRILIFTLLDDRVAEFDRLAEQAAEEVRTGEPDTLVYVIHLVPNAPLQRIFYEIYRDRAAFDSHENKPYMQRFVAERRACVLATNVIELQLKYAKVAPLPAAQAAPQAPAAVPAPAARPPLPAGPPRGGSGPQRLQPPPPARPYPAQPQYPYQPRRG